MLQTGMHHYDNAGHVTSLLFYKSTIACFIVRKFLLITKGSQHGVTYGQDTMRGFLGPDRNNLNQVRRPFSETRLKRWKKYKFSSIHVPQHYFSTQIVHLNHFNMVVIDCITFAILPDKSAILIFFQNGHQNNFFTNFSSSKGHRGMTMVSKCVF